MVNNRKKLKKLLHQKNKQIKKHKKKDNPEEFNVKDSDIALPFATAEGVKLKGQRHELNRIRRFTAKHFLNKYRYSATDHSLIKPYYYLRKWFNWSGIVADISMPTGNDSTKLDGKVLIDKFCFENELTGEKELLDHHIWLNVNNIRYLMNGSKLTLGIGDVIQATSRAMQYSGKGGLIEKFGLGSTVIKAGGVLVSYTKNIASPKSQVITSNYDHGDDWVLKLDNSGIPDITLQNYNENKDIRIFANKEHGHVLATYQPSRYEHYFDRLQDGSSNTVFTEPQGDSTYSAVVSDYKIFEQDGELVPKIILKEITNEKGRIVCAYKTLDINDSLLKLGTLRKDDEISFSFDGTFDHLKENTLHKFKLLTNHPVYDLPKERILLIGWIMNNFYYGIARNYEIIGKYLHWQQVISRENVEVTPENFDEYYGLSISDISKKVNIEKEVLDNYLKSVYPNNSDILYSFIDNTNQEHRYYRPEVLKEVEEHFKHTSKKAQSALERAQAIKNEYSHQVKDRVSSIPKNRSVTEFEETVVEESPQSPVTSKFTENKVQPKSVKEIKTPDTISEEKTISKSDAPVKDEKIKQPSSIISNSKENTCTVEFICETGTYTSDQFDSYMAAANYIQKLIQTNKLNQFIFVKDEIGQDSMISIKQILEVKMV